MVADAILFRPGRSTPCGAQGQLNECGSAICGGAPSLVHRLLSRCSRFVVGSHEGRLCCPETSVNHRAV